MALNSTQKDLLLLGFCIMELNQKHGVKAKEFIPEYDAEYVKNMFDKSFVVTNEIAKLKEVATECYKRLSPTKQTKKNNRSKK